MSSTKIVKDALSKGKNTFNCQRSYIIVRYDIIVFLH